MRSVRTLTCILTLTHTRIHTQTFIYTQTHTVIHTFTPSSPPIHAERVDIEALAHSISARPPPNLARSHPISPDLAQARLVSPHLPPPLS